MPRSPDKPQFSLDPGEVPAFDLGIERLPPGALALSSESGGGHRPRDRNIGDESTIQSECDCEMDEEAEDEALSLGKKTRWVHYGDPDYFEHLPPHLRYIKNLPFTVGLFPGLPSYEVDIDPDRPDNF